MAKTKIPPKVKNFYPRSPCGERPATTANKALKKVISIHALLAESDGVCDDGVCGVIISIHALLAESDLRAYQRYFPPDISIHALLAESDVLTAGPLCPPKNFYPRSPCGERHLRSCMPTGPRYFYPRSPCGERRCPPHTCPQFLTFYFYPRSPCGERRIHYDNYNLHCVISIHALLAESDTPKLSRVVPTPIFLSTLSLRRATLRSPRIALMVGFLSTLSLRRATLMWYQCNTVVKISIHALLAESDTITGAVRAWAWHFYPRSPCGERPA